MSRFDCCSSFASLDLFDDVLVFVVFMAAPFLIDLRVSWRYVSIFLETCVCVSAIYFEA